MADHEMTGTARAGGAGIPPHARVARFIKEALLKCTDHGAMPPVVMVERGDGSIGPLVVAPAVDRDLGLRAAMVLRKAHDDLAAIVLATDAYYRAVEGADDPGPAPGELQATAEAGGKVAERVHEAIMAVRVPREGRAEMFTSPYFHAGRGTPFRWLDSQALGGKAEGGHVPTVLAHVMAARAAADEVAEADPELAAWRAAINPAEWRAVASRVALRTLAAEGFAAFSAARVGPRGVVELVPWTGAR